jgi:uracil-DNA glycosylase
MKKLLDEISECQLCKDHLPYLPKPILALSAQSKILIIGQAPGQKVQDTGIPWNDKSGDELRLWLGVNKQQFYDTRIFGIMPMGFCYPGKGKSGDLPPRPECADTWHKRLFSELKNVELILLVGSYAQNYYLKDHAKNTLTETVSNFKEYLPRYFPLVHPSPRNGIWQKKNAWFKKDVIPELQRLTHSII